jgi:hypothetical protein
MVALFSVWPSAILLVCVCKILCIMELFTSIELNTRYEVLSFSRYSTGNNG